MSTAARVAVVPELGADFEIRNMKIADPSAHEVLVRIRGVGICHTDLAVQSGDLPTHFPVVLGHEGSGTIAKVGAHVADLAAGDQVVLSYGSCGHCRPCAEGDPAYCVHFNALNFLNERQDSDHPVFDGGPNASFFQQSSFATYAIAHERNVVKIESEDDIALFGPLGCGIQTGAGAVLRTARVPAGSTLLVSGVGSVGMSAVMAARIAGCSKIIAVDLNAERLELAKQLGATDGVDVTRTDSVAEAVRRIVATGVDYAIECSGNATAARDAWSSLANRGTLVVVGAPPDGTDYAFDANEHILSGRRIVGCVEGDSHVKQFIPELVAMYTQGRFPFDRLVKRYPFDQINRAVSDLKQGRVLKPILELA